MRGKKNQVLTIQDAKYLMDVLDKDIDDWEKPRIALLLLILSANPDLAKDGKEVVGYSPRAYCGGMGDQYGFGYDCEYY